MPFLLNFILFLAFPFVGGYLARRYRLPSIIGYILGGVALGVFLGEKVSAEFLPQLANIGVILLLFSVGLEANLENLRRFGRFVLLGGILQIFLSAVFIFILALLFKFALLESLFIGSSFALSSTAVVLKIVQDRGEENSLVGGLIVGILVLQDLAVIPLIIIFSSFGQGLKFLTAAGNISLAILKSAAVLLFVYYLGKRVTPAVFDRLAKLSREILNLFTILFIVFFVYLFSLFGLPGTLAAFASGVLIGQTLEHYHIFSQIRPLRDLFVILFFVFLGASVKLSLVFQLLPKILLFSSALILVKFLIVLLIFFFFRFHSRTSFSIGLSLSQVGEFAFLIIYQGLTQKIISQQTYFFATTVVLLTIAATPILIAKKNKIYQRIKKLIKKYLAPLDTFITQSFDREPAHIEVLEIKDHVILCGLGRVGSYIGRAFSMAEIPYIAIDYNFYVVERARKRGVNIIYGDPTDIDILDYAECEDAVALVSAVPERFSQESIILNAKRLNPKIKIFTRVEKEADQRRMKDLGADVVVQPEFEASLSIIKKILLAFSLPKEEIVGKIKRLKLEHGMT